METLQRTANRGSISTGYDIDNSLKFEHDNSEELNFTPSSSGSNQTWTFSCWFKLTELDKVNPIFGHYTSADNQALIRILNTNNELSFRLVNGGTIRELKSDMLFRDTSAWSHLVVAVDTTDSTSTNRVKIYVNGSQITVTGTYPTPSLVTYGINTSGINMDIGGSTTATPTFYGFSGYMAEIHHIDGQQLAPTEFGETDEDTGIWKPKEYDGTYGTNGAYLNFSNSGSLGEDSAGSNDWTLNNITSADQATDTPTNNFCTINTLQPYASTTTITEGATKMGKTAAAWQTAFATMGITSGKWYWEYKTSETDNMTGIADIDTFSSFGTSTYLGQTTTSWSYYAYNGKYINNSTETTYGDSFSSSNIIGVALDMDNNKLYFAKDNTWQNSGDPTSGSTGTGAISITSGIYYTPSASIYDNTDEQEFNFGGYTTISISSSASDANGYGNFEYAPPSGYYALCSKNLAEKG